MRDSQGQLIGVLGVARDITRRKQTALQLDDYRQRLEGLVVEESTKFRALVEQSLVGIYIIQDGFFRYANPGLLRCSATTLRKNSWTSFPPTIGHARGQGTGRENIRRRIEGEMDSTRYSFTAYKRDGTLMIVDAHGRRIEYQGRPAIIGTLVDITEMRRSKDDLGTWWRNNRASCGRAKNCCER